MISELIDSKCSSGKTKYAERARQQVLTEQRKQSREYLLPCKIAGGPYDDDAQLNRLIDVLSHFFLARYSCVRQPGPSS